MARTIVSQIKLSSADVACSQKFLFNCFSLLAILILKFFFTTKTYLFIAEDTYTSNNNGYN